MKILPHTLLLIILLLSACSNPLNTKYNPDTLEEDMKVLKEELPTEDFELIGAYILSQAMQNNSLEGDSYKSILATAKEQKAIQEQREAENAAKVEEMKGYVDINLKEKDTATRNYRSKIYLTIDLINKSDKDIKAFKGKVHFADVMDDHFYSIALSVDNPLPADSTVEWFGGVDHNEFIDGVDKLARTKLDKLNVSWEPTKILFMDDSTLAIEE